MTYRFVVVAEDELGYRLARDLADRVVVERGAPWLQDLWRDGALREQQRRWTGIRSDTRWSPRGEIKQLAEKWSIRAHGHGMKAERAMAHKAAALVTKLMKYGEIDTADALFLVHDTDGERGVSESLRDGAHGAGGPRDFRVLVATPHPESEAWVIAGILQTSSEEKDIHRQECQRLGFDPVLHPDLLTSNRSTDKRDAKRICEALAGTCSDGYQRWERAWMETPIDRLEQNAGRAGLRDYTRQVEEILLPLLGDTGLR